jgi:Cd2+/Zn2+-exporting ATPase
MGDDLEQLPFVMRLGRSTRAIIMQNVAFSLIVKAIFMFLALQGQATLWMAVFADVGASLIVILNGMRLLRRRPQRIKNVVVG